MNGPTAGSVTIVHVLHKTIGIVYFTSVKTYVHLVLYQHMYIYNQTIAWLASYLYISEITICTMHIQIYRYFNDQGRYYK